MLRDELKQAYLETSSEQLSEDEDESNTSDNEDFKGFNIEQENCVKGIVEDLRKDWREEDDKRFILHEQNESQLNIINERHSDLILDLTGFKE